MNKKEAADQENAARKAQTVKPISAGIIEQDAGGGGQPATQPSDAANQVLREAGRAEDLTQRPERRAVRSSW